MMNWTISAENSTDHMDFIAEYEKINCWRLILPAVQWLAACSMMLMPLKAVGVCLVLPSKGKQCQRMPTNFVLWKLWVATTNCINDPQRDKIVNYKFRLCFQNACFLMAWVNYIFYFCFLQNKNTSYQ